MASRLLGVVNLEVREKQPPVDVRRIKTINVVALFALFFNVLYSILYAPRWQGGRKTSSRFGGH